VSVCINSFLLLGNGSVAKQRLSENVPAATNTRNNRIIVGHVVFCAVRVLLKKSLWVCLCITLPLLKTFPRQKELLEASSSIRSVSYQRKIRRLFLTLDLSCLQHLGMDRTENTVPLLLVNCCLADHAEHTILSCLWTAA
jgi:hypothetical protein